MSVDLDWEHLNSSLAESLVELLNRQLTSITRPSFVGPVEVTSFDFGTAPPNVEVVDLRNIHPDFLEENDDDETGGRNIIKEEDEDDFEWVSRRAMRGKGMQDGYLPDDHGDTPPPMMDMFGSTPWNPAMANMLDVRASYPSLAPQFHAYRTSLYSRPFPLSQPTPPPPPEQSQRAPSSSSPISPAPATNHPNLQVHLRITWQSNLRLTLATSLLINYPSPMFMSLPIKLSVTGLLFNGQLAVAYQGDRRRVHLCILDDLDPYNPSSSSTSKQPSTPLANSEEDLPTLTGFLPAPRGTDKPPPIGQRLLPNIYIESEIGQADKHVLKNVTRVEKFIQDVIRKTVEEELVFPNFHTLVFGDLDQ